MNSILEKLYNGLKAFLGILLTHNVRLVKDLWKAKDKIEPRYLWNDFLSILRSVGMIAFFNLLALFIFTMLPQGRDVLLIIVEDILHFTVGNLFWLLIGIIFWSIISEFGTRYSLYVTDNSGRSLSEDRVRWRKAVQKAIADLFFMLPFYIVAIGFIINYFQDKSLDPTDKKIGFGVPILCLYLVFNLLSKFYFRFRNKQRMLPDCEWEWCNKLIGIYNDYVFEIRHASNFTNKINRPLEVFTDNFVTLETEERNNFPKNPEFISEESQVPLMFRFLKYSEGTKDEDNKLVEKRYKWVYKIPIKFYPVLHKQVRLLVLSCVGLFTLICFSSTKFHSTIGAPGLIVIAFACWSGIWIGLIYLDYAALRNSKISVRFMLLFLLLFSSAVNKDHPVRFNDNRHQFVTQASDTLKNYSARLPLKEHFAQWFNNYKSDSNTQYHHVIAQKDTSLYPVVFVCAEGGALRTGAFTAETLAFLQDSLANNFDHIDFKKTIYVFSGVSGGSLGIAHFNSIAYLSNPDELQEGSYTELTHKFFKQDFLSPVIGKMFYGDIVNLFLPFHVERFDRAIALEKAWELGYKEDIKNDSRNIFSSDFIDIYQNHRLAPAVFINTEEVETGFQCWLTNVQPDTAMFFSEKRDLFNYKIQKGINLSTATNFSSRFPFFSPAGALIQDDNKKFHYADGGYVENSGAATMLEVLKVLKEQMLGYHIVPFVLMLRYSNDIDGGGTDKISFGNEISEILYGIYNTRSGRGKTATAELKRFVDTTFRPYGKVLEFPLSKTNSEVPLNWVLSDRSLNMIDDDIKAKWKNKGEKPLSDFFAMDTSSFITDKKWRQRQLPDSSPKKKQKKK